MQPDTAQRFEIAIVFLRFLSLSFGDDVSDLWLHDSLEIE